MVETVLVEVKERSFWFISGSDRATVECRHCGWKRSPGWRDYQRVFDLSNGHECAGVEAFEQMRRRTAVERAGGEETR